MTGLKINCTNSNNDIRRFINLSLPDETDLNKKKLEYAFRFYLYKGTCKSLTLQPIRIIEYNNENNEFIFYSGHSITERSLFNSLKRAYKYATNSAERNRIKQEIKEEMYVSIDIESLLIIVNYTPFISFTLLKYIMLRKEEFYLLDPATKLITLNNILLESLYHSIPKINILGQIAQGSLIILMTMIVTAITIAAALSGSGSGNSHSRPKRHHGQHNNYPGHDSYGRNRYGRDRYGRDRYERDRYGDSLRHKTISRNSRNRSNVERAFNMVSLITSQGKDISKLGEFTNDELNEYMYHIKITELYIKYYNLMAYALYSRNSTIFIKQIVLSENINTFKDYFLTINNVNSNNKNYTIYTKIIQEYNTIRDSPTLLTNLNQTLQNISDEISLIKDIYIPRITKPVNNKKIVSETIGNSEKRVNSGKSNNNKKIVNSGKIGNSEKTKVNNEKRVNNEK